MWNNSWERRIVALIANLNGRKVSNWNDAEELNWR